MALGDVDSSGALAATVEVVIAGDAVFEASGYCHEMACDPDRKSPLAQTPSRQPDVFVPSARLPVAR